MSEIIRDFNTSMYEGLKIIVNKGKENGLIENPFYYRAYYNLEKDKFEVSKPTKRGFNKDYIEKFSNDYIEYFWVEFSLGEKLYKISMFFKDFDHETGNIHILPGMIQFWEKKHDINHEKDEYFVVFNGYTSKEKSTPYCNHKGGTIFCEEEWVPCAYNVCEETQKFAKDFCMQWDYKNNSAEEIADRLFDELDIKNIQEKMKTTDLFKGICYEVSESINTLNELYNEVYKNKTNYSEEGWQRIVQGHCKSAYKYLKWQVFREDKTDSLSTRRINIFYKTLYLKNYGYFTVFGNGINQCLDYNEKQKSELYINRKKEVDDMPEGNEKAKNKGFLVAGPNYAFEKDGNIYWKLLY